MVSDPPYDMTSSISCVGRRMYFPVGGVSCKMVKAQQRPHKTLMINEKRFSPLKKAPKHTSHPVQGLGRYGPGRTEGWRVKR